jgi:uncharacterized protein (TIGR00369 family)
MTDFKAANPNFEADARAVFERQTVMKTLGASLVKVLPGEVVIELPFRDDLTQQAGFMHAGIITTVVDTACGCASFTLMPAGVDVLTVEYKINLLSPAVGALFRAYGRVTKPGKTITVCQGDVYAVRDGGEKLVATMLSTLILRQPSDMIKAAE